MLRGMNLPRNDPPALAAPLQWAEGALLSAELDTAKRYRLHGEELRAMATDKSTPEIRQSLLGLAVDYEKMASSMEAIDTTNRLLREAGITR